MRLFLTTPSQSAIPHRVSLGKRGCLPDCTNKPHCARPFFAVQIGLNPRLVAALSRCADSFARVQSLFASHHSAARDCESPARGSVAARDWRNSSSIILLQSHGNGFLTLRILSLRSVRPPPPEGTISVMEDSLTDDKRTQFKTLPDRILGVLKEKPTKIQMGELKEES
jgi:hypothetical protein